MDRHSGYDKSYLTVAPLEKGASIVASPEHADELVLLFGQRGFPCRRERDVSAGNDALRFDERVDVEALKRVLEGYKNPKGS